MPKPGDFFVTRTNGWAGLLIRIGTRSTVNHAGVVITDSGTIVEAEGNGARIGNISEYPDAIFSSMPLTDSQRWLICYYARKFVDTPYNWVDIFALFCSRVLGLKSRRVNKRLSDHKTLICSQLVDAAYDAAGVRLFDDGRPDGDVTPEDLKEVIERCSTSSSTSSG